MAPKTPKKERGRQEWDTIKRTRFFDAFDSKSPQVSFNSLCQRPEISIPPATGRYWLKQREKRGSPTFRRTRKLSSRLGRAQKVSESDLDRLIDPNDPIHQAPPSTQIEELNLHCTTRTLRSNLRNRRNAGRYKQSPVAPLSDKNQQLRTQYGVDHCGKTITGWWQYLYFTDEAHFNSVDLAYRTQYETRQSGGASIKHLQPTPKAPINVTLHVAAGVSYNHKGAFTFYHDPQEPSIKLYKPRRPRKSSVETEDEHLKAISNWLDGGEHPLKVQAQGNSMTQEFYAEHILPLHIKHIKWLEQKYKRQVVFMEDNDPSHGHRNTRSRPMQLKLNAGITTLQHPAQSPDLNPIEPIWMIIKERLRGGTWPTVTAFKIAIEREWRRVSQGSIRRRIREMPARCQRLIDTKGARIRSNLW